MIAVTLLVMGGGQEVWWLLMFSCFCFFLGITNLARKKVSERTSISKDPLERE